MRGRRLVLPILLLAGLGCRSAKTVPEPGAILLHVKCAAGVPTPDELRAWVYDDGGSLWTDVRIPATGPLVPVSAQDLGTILIAPGPVRGKLRLHIRGLVASARAADGTRTVDAPTNGDRTYDLVLEAAVPADDDGDDVPDSLDDCPGTSNPTQGGCPAVTPPDAGPEVGQPEAGADGPAPADEVAPPTDPVAEQAPDEPGADGLVDLPPDLLEGDLVVGRADAGADAGGDVRPDAAVDADASVKPDTSPDLKPDRRADGIDGGGVICVDGGVCSLLPQGSLCGDNSECGSGFCADGVCCTNACTGPCRSCNQPNNSGVCQGYAAGTDPEVECASGNTCNGVGACGPLPPPNLPNGQLCTVGTQCLSGFCTDGVCCENACNGPCQTCGTGACLQVKKADDIPECTGSMTCNPRGACVAR